MQIKIETWLGSGHHIPRRETKWDTDRYGDSRHPSDFDEYREQCNIDFSNEGTVEHCISNDTVQRPESLKGSEVLEI